MSFLKDLKRENTQIYKYIASQIDNVKSKLDNIQNIFKEYTDHSSIHAQRVLENGERLNTCGLNIYEKSLFILAAYFHDIGMNVPQGKIDLFIRGLEENLNLDFYLSDITKSQAIEKSSLEQKKQNIALNHFREKHNIFTADYILEQYPKDNKKNYINGVYLWDNLAIICKAHTLSINELQKNSEYSTESFLENRTKVNILYLSLLLRLADICHFSKDRAFPYLFKYKIFTSNKSKRIWSYYADIVTTIPDIETKTIKIHAYCENFYNHRAIINDSKNIQEELLNSHRLLNKKNSKYQFVWKYVDDTNITRASNAKYHFHDIKFNLKKSKIIDLLMGEKLYGDKLYAIRECIQNSIDAIKISSKKIREGHYIYLKYSDDESPILDVYDSGTGMNFDIISENFLSVGSKSYWYTEKALKEWNIEYKSLDLIADHGIGALSYFMIADKLEIYTKYQLSSDFFHIYIDDLKDSIIHKDTEFNKYPIFTSKKNISNPWDLQHGTCIRFHLNRCFTFNQLIDFLAINIIRCPIKLILNYNSTEFILPNVWHFRDEKDHYAYPKKKYEFYSDIDENETAQQNNKTNVDIFNDLYKKEYDLYSDHPPNDKSVNDNAFKTLNLKGKVQINFWNEYIVPCRISQNGILIKNSVDFVIENKKTELLTTAFGFDIDITGQYCFQLDAERTSIINNDYNKNIFNKLEDILIDHYFSQISKIESSIYFRCGNKFYHGMTDMIFGNDNALNCFNENFKEIFIKEIYIKYKKYIESFDSAKLYMTGIERCKPVSVIDLKKFKERLLLIPKNKLSPKGLMRSRFGEKYVDTDKFLKRINVKINNKTIYFADNKNTFIQPLLINFKFIKKEENDYIYLFRLKDEKYADNEIIEVDLNKLWE